MDKSLILISYMIDKPISFISFFIGKIPLWILLYLIFLDRINMWMFLLLGALIYISRSYFDVEIFEVNPIYSIFSSIFYSIFKPALFFSIMMMIFLAALYFFITQNIFVLIISAIVASIFLSGMTIFFRREYFNALWRIKNAPQINGLLFKGFFINILWLISITTPFSLSVLGLFIIYVLEFNNLLKEFDGLL